MSIECLRILQPIPLHRHNSHSFSFFTSPNVFLRRPKSSISRLMFSDDHSKWAPLLHSGKLVASNHCLDCLDTICFVRKLYFLVVFGKLNLGFIPQLCVRIFIDFPPVRPATSENQSSVEVGTDAFEWALQGVYFNLKSKPFLQFSTCHLLDFL